MIEANKLIFPFPKHNKSNSSYLQSIKSNIIYLPKSGQALSGCMCDTISHHHKNPSSIATTSRSHQNEGRPQTTKIQPSKQFKLKMLQPKHKRSSTRLINLVASQVNGHKENNYVSQKTPREMVRNNFQDKIFHEKMHKYLTKVKPKFLSDDLYEEQPSEEFENQLKIETVRIAHLKFNSFSHRNVCSKLWTYQNKDQITIKEVIPCLYYQSFFHPCKIIIYFHGNGQDIVGCSHFLKNLSNVLETSVLAIEYPGYSLYEGSPNSEQIQKDGMEVIQFLIDKIGFQAKNILVMGRSIGSGPAVFISSKFQVGGLILLSPFLSLCEVVGDLYGNLASNLLKQRFNNKQRAKNVMSPCLIVHGTRDRLISQKHASELSQYFQSYCMTRLVHNMSHSIFNQEQFFRFVKDFQKVIQFY